MVIERQQRGNLLDPNCIGPCDSRRGTLAGNKQFHGDSGPLEWLNFPQSNSLFSSTNCWNKLLFVFPCQKCKIARFNKKIEKNKDLNRPNKILGNNIIEKSFR